MSMFSIKLLLIVLIINIVIFFLISYIGIKLSKLNKLNVIHIRQYFVSMLSTVVISALLPTIIASVLFLILFFIYRNVVFRRDSLEEQRIYSFYVDVKDYPQISSFQEALFFKNEDNRMVPLQRKYLYSFSRYICNAGYIFLFYCAKNAIYEGNTILFGIEYFVAFTALFIVLAKVVYHLSLTTPSSLFFLLPNLSYVPVVFSGLLFYFFAVLIFLNII